MKRGSSFGLKPNCSGFDTSEWIPRDSKQHIKDAKKTSNAVNKTEKSNLESSLSSRYSVLFELPYFDSIRMYVIDPMHNLLLGLSKCTFKTWIRQGHVTKESIKDIDKWQIHLQIPEGTGRIAHKMPKAYKNVKADEWKVGKYKQIFKGTLLDFF